MNSASISIPAVNNRIRGSGSIAADNSIALSSGYPERQSPTRFKLAFDMTNSQGPGRQATYVRRWNITFNATRNAGFKPPSAAAAAVRLFALVATVRPMYPALMLASDPIMYESAIGIPRLPKAIARRNARNAGSAGAAFTNQAISNALINANLASSLSQSYMTEEQQNTAIKNQEEQINQQVRIQEKLADQQDLALRKSTVSQALHNIGMNTQGFAKDLESARVGNINNEMWFNAIKEGKYVDMRYDAATGSTVIINKDGSVWNKAADGSITEVKPDKKLSKKEQETISNLFIK